MITVSGTGKYDGDWKVTKAFPYKDKKDKKCCGAIKLKSLGSLP